MKLVVDTGVFSAALSRRPRSYLETAVARLVSNQPTAIAAEMPLVTADNVFRDVPGLVLA